MVDMNVDATMDTTTLLLQEPAMVSQNPIVLQETLENYSPLR